MNIYANLVSSFLIIIAYFTMTKFHFSMMIHVIENEMENKEMKFIYNKIVN